MHGAESAKRNNIIRKTGLPRKEQELVIARYWLAELPGDGPAGGMALAVMLANQHRAGFEVPTCRTVVSGEAVQGRQAFAIEAAKGLLPDDPTF